MNEPVYTPMNIAAVAAMSAELDRMKASHQALIDALEAIVDIGARAVPAGYESFTDEQKKLYPIIYSEEAHVAQDALKLAKGEA